MSGISLAEPTWSEPVANFKILFVRPHHVISLV